MIDALAFDARTLCEAFQRTADRHADAPALRRAGDADALTWREYAERVERLAGALAAHGVERGDTVAMLLANRPEAHLVDMACVHLGALAFNLPVTASAEQLAQVLGHARAKVAIVAAAAAGRLDGVLDGLEHLERVFALDGAVPGMRPVDELLATPAPARFDFVAAWTATGRDDVAALVYAPPGSGPPKGVELTHGSLLGTLRAYHRITPYEPGGRVISHLPTAHLADRMSAHYVALVTGACVTTLDDPARLGEALREVRPTSFMALPREWAEMKGGVERRLASRASRSALDAALQRVRLAMRGEPTPPELEALCERADAEVFSAVRVALGLDEARALYSGAGPLATDVLEFYLAIGLPLLEVWGKAETSAAGTANRPGRMRPGTAGVPLPGAEVRLDSDGRLLFRGPGAMRGYRDDPDGTARTVDADGWIDTGDVAAIDDDGFVRIL